MHKNCKEENNLIGFRDALWKTQPKAADFLVNFKSDDFIWALVESFHGPDPQFHSRAPPNMKKLISGNFARFEKSSPAILEAITLIPH